MAKYRKKPVVIEAAQFHGGTIPQEFDRDAAEGRIKYGPGNSLKIPTLEGEMLALNGDWIIRGVKGELYPCKPEIFAATYDPV